MLSPLTLLFPPVCPICGIEVNPGEVICRKCKTRLPIIINSTWQTENLNSARAVFLYRDPVKLLLIKIKYHHDITLAYLLGREIGKIIRENNLDLGKFDCIVPVPTSQKRKKKRLYNQTEEMLKGIKRELSLPRLCTIKRIKQEKSQVGLTKEERKENIKGAFQIPGKVKEKLKGKRILLFDDVYTTGSTADEIALTLRSAEVKEVHLLVCCRGEL